MTFPFLLSEQSSRQQQQPTVSSSVNRASGNKDVASVSTVSRKSATIRDLTTAIYYVQAVLCGHVLRDVDILPLQGMSWQTNVVSLYKFLIYSR